MSTMWRWHSTGLVMALAVTCLLAGCGKRQAVGTLGDGRQLDGVPDDQGGYAGSLAAPPESVTDVDVEEIIEAGSATDVSETMRPDDDEHSDAATPEEPERPTEPDRSGDSAWDSVQNPVVAFHTTKGVFYLELWKHVAPKHAANMVKLLRSKFYDQIFVHRVEPRFVMQVGCPFTKMEGPMGPNVGTGGPGWSVPAEFSDKPHVRGTLSMARSADPDSGGSQFFVVLDRAEHLDGKYSVFGQILGEGMIVVDKLEVGDQVLFAWVVHE